MESKKCQVPRLFDCTRHQIENPQQKMSKTFMQFCLTILVPDSEIRGHTSKLFIIITIIIINNIIIIIV
jgi:hypothetical protein